MFRLHWNGLTCAAGAALAAVEVSDEEATAGETAVVETAAVCKGLVSALRAEGCTLVESVTAADEGFGVTAAAA
jgi:hypothetical protein